MDTPQVLLKHYLKPLKLPAMLREYARLAEQCAKEGVDFQRFLLRLVEAEMLERDRKAAGRRIKAAKFTVVKSLETSGFLAIPSLNKKRVLELARCEWITRRENVLALGHSGTGKTHIALALGLAESGVRRHVRRDVVLPQLVNQIRRTVPPVGAGRDASAPRSRRHHVHGRRACRIPCAKNSRASSSFSSRSRFLLNTAWFHTGSSRSRPTNQRYSRLLCTSSTNCRSLRMLNSICRIMARSSRSGAIEGRPRSLHISSNCSDGLPQRFIHHHPDSA